MEIVCEIRDRWNNEDGEYSDPSFRGHRESGWKLQPNIVRLQLDEVEMQLRDSFQRMAVQLMSEREPKDEWSWYFIMQHYGAPTRLLDWTDGALIALLFAVTPQRPGAVAPPRDAEVWMLSPWWLNKQVVGLDTILSPGWTEVNRYLPSLFSETKPPRLPVAIDPPHIARRIGVQRGHFTVFGTDPDGLAAVAAKGRMKNRLVNIVIKKENIDRIRLDLGTAGIGETTVFPDLEGLSRELIRFWTEEWDYVPPPQRTRRTQRRK